MLRRFESAPSARRFLDAFARAGTPFRPGRHLLSAHQYRAPVREHVAT